MKFEQNRILAKYTHAKWLVGKDSSKIVKITMWAMPNVMAALPNIGGALC